MVQRDGATGGPWWRAAIPLAIGRGIALPPAPAGLSRHGWHVVAIFVAVIAAPVLAPRSNVNGVSHATQWALPGFACSAVGLVGAAGTSTLPLAHGAILAVFFPARRASWAPGDAGAAGRAHGGNFLDFVDFRILFRYTGRFLAEEPAPCRPAPCTPPRCAPGSP